jgi:hypothetical protein
MILETLTFNSEINYSLQVGDMVYYSPTNPPSGGSKFETISSGDYGNIVKFGVVTELFPNGDPNAGIPPNSIVVVYDNNAGVSPPQLNDYIMFAKDKEVNSSSLIGYYAEVTFKNNATDNIELFSISSEVSESSK